MALAPNTTPVTVRINLDGKAAYTPILAHAGGSVAAANAHYYVYPDGVTTQTPPATETGAIAVGETDANGNCQPMDLIPGCIYRVTTDDGSFTSARFAAGLIIGAVIVPGDNVSGA